ncbi:DUF4347 domain-containing protein [Variovorax robiniae]|uniref:DUF4347 domain-containing protein n=1 Tax=Variovorax robiniae TaxID=1836199 RepID=A0ABU8X8A2_9BURK
MFKRSRTQKRQSTVIQGKPAAQPKKMRLQALEPRVLLDAAAAATATAMAEQAQPQAVHDAPDAHNADLMQALQRANAQAVAPVDAGGARSADTAHPANVYFIDRSLPDVDTLVKDLGPNAEVHFIEPGQDGIQAIADVLQGRTDVASIQILSHGSEATVQLGTATLDAASMQGQYHDLLVAIGHSLSADGDILIYGCDFGAGADGLHAMELLSDITGADVGASADITGAADLGGNWVLERQVGSVEADVVSAGDWHHDLALGAPSGQITNPGFTGTTGWTSDTGFASGSGWYLSGNTMLMYAENAKSSVTWNAPINGWNFGPGTNGAATVSVDFAFNNGDNPAVAATNGFTSCTFDIQVGGVTYARVTTPPGGASNEAGTATVTYLNGASGNVSTIAATPWGSWAYTTILVSLPKGIADGSQLRLVGNSTNAADDMTFDNVQVYTSPYINTTPVAVNDTVVTAEDTPVALNLLANDTDADGDTLKVYSLNNVTLTPGTAQSISVPNGTVDVAASGAMTFRPNADYNGTSSFTYVAADPMGAKSTATVNLTITPVNDAPVLNPAAVLTLPDVNEDAPLPAGGVGQLVSSLMTASNVTDVDAGAVKGMAVTGVDTSHGTWYYSTNNGTTWSAIMGVSDANALLLSASSNARVYFRPNADWNGTDTGLTVRAWDTTSGVNGGFADATVNGGTSAFSSASDTIAAKVLPVNDAPVNNLPAGGWSTNEDTAMPITGLSIADVDAGTGSMQVRIYVNSGTLTANSGSGVAVTGSGTGDLYLTGTRDAINAYLASAGTPVFNPVANFNGSVSILVQTNDNGNTGSGGALTDSDWSTINVASVNDAPVLNPSIALTLPAVQEDAGPPVGGVGQYVYYLTTGAGNTTDVDTGAVSGVAITGADSSHGTWWYSIDNGTTWKVMGPVSDANALLLSHGSTFSRVYFQPNADWYGTLPAGLTIRAWDKTSGVEGGRADTTVNGGSTAFSAATAKVSQTVNPVADIVADYVTTVEDTPVTFNPITGAGESSGADNFEDPGRIITAVGGTAITAGGPAVAVANGMVSLAADGSTLNFTPSPDYNGTAVFSYTVTSGGGATETANINITVTPVADAPRIDLDTSTPGTDYAAVFDQAPIAIGRMVSLVDPDGAESLTSMTVKLTNVQAGDVLSAGGLPSGLTGTYNPATGVYTITGYASPANYQTALSLIQFSTTSGSLADRVIEVQAFSSVAPMPSNIARTTVRILDTDSDGVANVIDIDDDNDGILDINEDLLPPSLVDGTNEGAIGVAWTEDTNTGSLNSTVAGTGWNPYEGSPDTWKGPFSLNGSGYWGGAMNGVPGAADGEVFMAIYNGFTNESVFRTIPASAGIQVGDAIQINYAQIFGGVNGLTPVGRQASFVFTIDGVDYVGPALTYEGNVVKSWSEASFTFIAKSATPTIIVSITSTGDGNYLGFDSFKIFKVADVQALRDPDHDGIPNRLDIDSDNDGITDNVEAQRTGSYIAPSGSGAAMIDLDHDGLDDRYDANVGNKTAAGSKGLTPADTDGDATPDFLDSDSDNDGKLDIVERGDGAPTSITSTADSDGDGLLDIFEGSNPNNGFVVNGNNLIGSNFNLADSDGDVAANGVGAIPLTKDFDYRDAVNAPLIDLNSTATGSDTSRQRVVLHRRHGRHRGRQADSGCH